MARVPLYLAVEGLKGAGKSTALEAVRRGLCAEGIRWTSLDPTAPGFGLHPLELMNQLPGANVDWLRERLYAYRSNRQGLRLRSAPERCDLILGDRSFITTLATRWHRTSTLGVRGHFESCRRFEWAIPLPSHVIYIDAPLEVLRKRIEARHRRYGVRDEQPEMLAAAGQAYNAIRYSTLRELASINWHVVDGTGSADKVAAEVLRVVLAVVRVPPLDAASRLAGA